MARRRRIQDALEVFTEGARKAHLRRKVSAVQN